MIKLINALELSIPENLVSYFGADTLRIELQKEIGMLFAELRLKGNLIGERDACSSKYFKERQLLFSLESKNKVCEVFFDKSGSERLYLEVVEFLDDNNVRTSTRVRWKIDIDEFLGVDKAIEEPEEDLMCIEEFTDYLINTNQWECTCHIDSPCCFCANDGVGELYNEYLEENGVDNNE